jgi:hypothetical protein
MLDNLINKTWKTNISVGTNSEGTASFRGFFGDYEISMTTADGKTRYYKVHVGKNEENRWIFTTD